MKYLKLLLVSFFLFTLFGCDTETETEDIRPVYTVTFLDSDDSIIEHVDVREGEDAVAPSAPTLEGHTFTGWDTSFTNVTSNLTVKAEFEINTYTVTFEDEEGNLIKSQTVTHGGNATSPMYPVKAGYRFVSWSAALENITQDVTLTPVYEIRTYTVTLIGHNDENIATLTIDHGSAVTFPDAPSIEGYTFLEWDDEGLNITQDREIQAVYQINIYTVTFLDEDSKVLSTQEVAFNADATAPTAPKKFGHKFVNWSSNFTEVSANLTLTPLYELETYTITYLDNLSSLEAVSWNSKEDFLQEFYSDFYLWLKENKANNENIVVSGDSVTVTMNGSSASFSNVAELRAVDKYAVELTLGNLIYKPFTRTVKEAINPTESEEYFLNTEPHRTKYQDLDRYFLHVITTAYTSYNDGYNATSVGKVQIFFRFHQWMQGTAIPAFETLPVKHIYTNPLDITISLPTTPNSYTIFSDLTISNPTYEENEVTFLGWFLNPYGAGEAVTSIKGNYEGNLKLYAKWDTDETTHDVIFMDHEQNILTTVTILSGESLTAPDAPVRTGYTFTNWDKDVDNITHDITFMPVYELNVYTITYHKNLDKVVTLPTNPVNYTILDNFTLPNAESANSMFLGWYLNPEGTGDIIQTTTHGDLELYAKWIVLPNSGESLSEDTFYLVASEETLYLDQSLRVYVKNVEDYFLSSQVTYLSSDASILTVDASGFVQAVGIGSAFIVATLDNQVATFEIHVTEQETTSKWIGHMGSRGPFVQNTTEAFQEGVQRGYAALEMDLRVTSDGVFYICHDDVFLPYLFTDSSLHNIPMGSYTWDQLKDLEIKNTRNSTVYTATLTRLETYLEIIRDNDVDAIIELKWTNGINNNDTRNVSRLIELVKEYGVYEKTTFFTSMQTVLNTIRASYKDANLMYLSGTSTTTQSNIDWAIQNKMSMGIPHNLITESIVTQLHEAGLYVNAYTVNLTTDVIRLSNLKVDYITTDDLGQ